MIHVLWLLAGSAGSFAVALAAQMLGQSAIETALVKVRTFGSRRRVEKRRRVIRSGALERWLVGYYRNLGFDPVLAVIQHAGRKRTVAMASPAAWLPTTSLDDLRHRALVVSAQNAIVRGHDRVTPRSVRRRDARLAVHVWDGDAMIVRTLPATYGSSVGTANAGFFDIAGPMFTLEDEAIRCASSKVHRARHRSRRGRNLADHVIGLGGNVVIVLDDRTGAPEVLIHRRADSVATMPGMWCTMPTFIMEDPAASSRENTTRDLVVWNVFREVLEEVFGWDDLSRALRRPHPDWFFEETRDGAALAVAFESGAARLLHLGWTVNLLNGFLDAMVALHVSVPPEEARVLRTQVRGSATEVDDQEGSIRWVSLHGDELALMCLEPTFQPGCALAIQLARSFIPSEPPRPQPSSE